MSIAAEPTREQTRARYPDEEGYVERDGVRVFWERYGDGPDRRPALSDLSHLALTALEGADPLPRAPAPRAHLRPARQRALRPARRRVPRTGTGSTSRTGGPSSRRRGSTRRSSSGSATGAAGRSCSRPRHPETALGVVALAPCLPYLTPVAPELHPLSVRRAARHGRGLGEVQPPLLAPRLSRLPRVLLLAADPGAALHEADRRLRRLGAGDGSRDARARRRGGARSRGAAPRRRRPSARPFPARSSSSTASWTPARRASARRPSPL